MMKKTAIALALLGFLGMGCKDDLSDIRNAIPTADTVKVNVPQGASAYASADGIGAAHQALGLEVTADFYQFTRSVSDTLNGGAGFVLLLVHLVVNQPYSTMEGDTYIWGPWHDENNSALKPAEWQLTVTPLDDGSYDWRFQGRNRWIADDPWKDVVYGIAFPGEGKGRGNGSFTMDFDAAEELDPVGNSGEGILQVTYDLTQWPATVEMHALNTQTDETIDYSYAQDQDGSGDFQFGLTANFDDTATAAQETAQVRSRWNNTGAGRADIRLQGGDFDTIVVTGTECWDTSYDEVYWTDSASWHETVGDPSACVFDTAVYFEM